MDKYRLCRIGHLRLVFVQLNAVGAGAASPSMSHGPVIDRGMETIPWLTT